MVFLCGNGMALYDGGVVVVVVIVVGLRYFKEVIENIGIRNSGKIRTEWNITRRKEEVRRAIIHLKT